MNINFIRSMVTFVHFKKIWKVLPVAIGSRVTLMVRRRKPIEFEVTMGSKVTLVRNKSV
jgi:hypothetical protein